LSEGWKTTSRLYGEYIERSKNLKVDELVKAIARNKPLLADMFFQVVPNASVKTIEPYPRLINLIEAEDWHTSIMTYLRHYYEPDNATKHIRMQKRAKAYQIVDNDLNKTSISSPLL
jgi:hypothetical protein